MERLERFVFGVRMMVQAARERRAKIDEQIAKDIALDPRNAATLRGITQIASVANRDAQATLDTLLDTLLDLLKSLDE